jgi:hypothetical protein
MILANDTCETALVSKDVAIPENPLSLPAPSAGHYGLAEKQYL